MFNAVFEKDRIVGWIRDFFRDNGKGCNAVVGISGGKDSSVVAALCCEALGKERVIGVLMPNGIQPDIEFANLLVYHLGIESYTVDISGAVDALKSSIPFPLSDQSRINLPPRIRMSTLYAVSQSNNGRVANTCNLSEDWVGYSTRYGDSVGDFSPCSGYTVSEMKQIGKALGLPAQLIEKPPSDGLTGKTDEDNLGFSYDELDLYIRTGRISDPEKKAKIDRLHRQNLFKLRLMPSFDPGLKIAAGIREQETGKSQEKPWTSQTRK
ncbi:MAG: NAD(+) synthase [Clostridia bacterium]|nr:NAD(+) synthase [Clostridia bacterium]